MWVSKNLTALTFHYLDPVAKDFELNTSNLANRTYDAILAEFEKCVLLCAKCHQEEHAPHLSYDTIDEYVQQNNGRALRRKIEFVRRSGGQCTGCGYDINLAALTFHHVDESKKAFKLDMRGLTYSRVTIEAELKKCILLCANCHMETHYPEFDTTRLEI